MKKVLIVDDDPVVRERLCRIIQICDDSACIFQTADVTKAYEAAVTNDIELILIDMMLGKNKTGDISGLKFVADIRRIEKYAFVPVIIVSSLLDDNLYMFRELHCYGFLEKPFSEENAIRLIRDALRFRMEKSIRKYVCFRQGCIIYPIRISEIIYIEHKRRQMAVHTTKEVIYIPYHTCSKTMEELGDCGFAICARGLIVNVEYIQSMDTINQYIILKDGHGRLELSRGYVKIIKNIIKQM